MAQAADPVHGIPHGRLESSKCGGPPNRHCACKANGRERCRDRVDLQHRWHWRHRRLACWRTNTEEILVRSSHHLCHLDRGFVVSTLRPGPEFFLLGAIYALIYTM